MKVELKQEIVEGLKECLKEEKGFKNVEDLIGHILWNYLSEMRSGKVAQNGKAGSHLKKIEQRLKDLGYV